MSPSHDVLTSKQRRGLRALAHDLKPVVHVGQHGVTEAVLAELDGALDHHELIKVRLHLPADKRAAAQALAERAGAALCGIIGHTVILFRRNPEEPKIKVPG